MQIVIDIPEEDFERCKKRFQMRIDIMGDAIAKGTPLPKGHGDLIDRDKFLERVEKDREHEIYMHSWEADDVLQRLDSWYAPTIIEADKAESEELEDGKID